MRIAAVSVAACRNIFRLQLLHHDAPDQVSPLRHGNPADKHHATAAIRPQDERLAFLRHKSKSMLCVEDMCDDDIIYTGNLGSGGKSL